LGQSGHSFKTKQGKETMKKQIIEYCKDIIFLAKCVHDAPQELIDKTEKEAVAQLMKIFQAMSDITPE
jgi:hypothetical protein